MFIQYCYDEGYGGFNTRKNFKWCRQDKAVIMAFKPEDVRRMVKSCNSDQLTYDPESDTLDYWGTMTFTKD